MKFILLSIILSILFITFSFATQINTSTNIDSIILAKMDQYHFPGLQACIVRDDSIIWKGSYGYANIDSVKPVTDSTLFNLASVSKPVTGTAIMQLWEEGLFDLDDDINNYLPFSVRNPVFPNDSITFRMLLTHTSSIQDNWNVLDPLVTWGMDFPDSLSSFLNNYLIPGGNHYTSNNWYGVVPGTQYNYSNVGVTIIGLLVEILANTSFENYCQDSIFVPLGMNETSWFLANLNQNNIATPYTYSGGIYTPNQHWGEPIFPAIQLRTSATQLSKFLSMFIQMGQFQNTRILDSSTVALMTTVQNPLINPYTGLIWFIREATGGKLGCGHHGLRNFGASSFIGYVLTGENAGIVVLANSGNDAGIMDIAAELMSYGILYGKIYAQNITLSSPFMRMNEDTLIVNTEFVNPNNHNFSSDAIIMSIDNAYNDSIPLFDDGNHGDGLAGDGIWGNYILPMSIENEFLVGFITTDLVSGDILEQNSQLRFTTIGPIVFEDYRITSSDTIPHHTDRLKFEFTLRNDGSTATATNVTSKVVSLDTFSIIYPLAKSLYGNIQPGSTIVGSQKQYIKFDLGSEDSIYVKFRIDISSNDYLFWSDTFSVFVHKDPAGIDKQDEVIPIEFALKQNYPNPFNPSTTIEFSIPKTDFVTIKIYNLLGQDVATLVSDKLTQGNYKFEWDASGFASGIYFYQLTTKNGFVQTRKLILMK